MARTKAGSPVLAMADSAIDGTPAKVKMKKKLKKESKIRSHT